MTTPEDRLRAALRDESPAPLDAGALIAGARREQAVNRARFAAAGAAVVLALAGGWRIMAPVADESAPSSAARGGDTYAPAATQAPPPAPSDAAEEASPAGEAAPRAQVIPGRVIVVHPERWCIADRADLRETDCTARSERYQRVRDSAGVEWLVVLAPSGPTTALLEVRQPSGWVSLETTPVHGHDDLWAGSIPGAEVPDAPIGVRASDASSTPIWHS